jgi:glycosyltransferase involved in cell wall biosynthesis
VKVLAITNDWPTPSFPGSGCQIRQFVKGLREIGVDIDVAFFNRRAHGMRVYAEIPGQLRSRLRDGKFDVVHVTYGGVMAERAISAIRNMPTVVSFCGSDLLGENLSGVSRKLVSKLGVLASYRAARLTTGIIVKSANLKRALHGIVDRKRIEIIPNGVDLNLFKPLNRDLCCSRLGWDPELFHVLFPLNSGDPVKRPHLAQSAVDVLGTMGIRSCLHYLNRVEHCDVPIHLNACNVLIVTSAHEGSPNIVKEALACDRPIVSVNVGDVADRIRNILGCYLSAACPQELALRLRQVHLGTGRVDGRHCIMDLSVENVSHRLRQVYSEVISRFGRSGATERRLNTQDVFAIRN